MTGRPIPVPDEVSAPFWANCAKHVFTLPRCSRCQAFSFPPDVVCPKCHSADPAFVFEPVSGEGKLRTWTVVRQSFLRGFETPFVLADVEFGDASDVRMIARLLDGMEATLAIGARVKVEFEDLAPGVSVPSFKMAES